MTFTIEDAIPSCISSVCVNAVQIAPTPEGFKEITAECIFPDTFPGFQGHFPNKPLLPGIIQLASVRNIVEQATGRNLTAQSYTGTKFKLPITPGQQVFIHITIEPSPHAIEGKFKIRSTAEKIISSGSFAFSAHQE